MSEETKLFHIENDNVNLINFIPNRLIYVSLHTLYHTTSPYIIIVGESNFYVYDTKKQAIAYRNSLINIIPSLANIDFINLRFYSIWIDGQQIFIISIISFPQPTYTYNRYYALSV